jgi:hypothetical protein
MSARMEPPPQLTKPIDPVSIIRAVTPHKMVKHANPNLGKMCSVCHKLERAALKNPNCPGAPE